MNLENDFNEENENIQEEVEPKVQEVQSDRETQSEVVVDYKQDFLILQNLGYIQVVLTGFLLFYFVFSLVYKYIKSFF